jgi:seryl-tRNA synthetase
MHDIRAIRENPTAYAAALSRRPTVDGDSEIKRIMALDEKVRAAILRKQEAEQARNAKSKEIGKAKAAKDEALAQSLMADVAAAKQTIEDAGKEEADATRERDDLLARLPNVPLEDVPEGADEHGNTVVRTVGTPRQFNYAPKDHADIGETMGMMDFEAATRMSGARFVVLRSHLARLERALTAFMLDIQTTENGYVEHAAPLLVRSNAMFGTGQLPKFEEDLFRVGPPADSALEAFGAVMKRFDTQKYRVAAERLANLFEQAATAANEAEAAGKDASWFDTTLKAAAEAGANLEATENELEEVELFFTQKMERFRAQQQEVKYLIPTAEVSLTNIYREQIVDGAALPSRMTAATPCFRSEAGSAGRDTKGMIRMHQFIKVELVSITKPEESEAEHERMTKCAEGILERLGLPYRTVLLCTGDMGFGARKTYDLEVWLPSQNTYREISSCSNCGDFQARRMDAKFRREQGAKPEFVHTLNGSGLAVGRTLVAVLENYQREDGKVDVPEALKPYMGGLEVIG